MIFHEAGHTAMFTYYEILEKWMRCAAAGEAAERRGYGRGPRDDARLVEIFEQTIEWLTRNPDTVFHHDMINFVRLALKRDEEVPPEQAGPPNWIKIWQEAEELICGQRLTQYSRSYWQLQRPT
jgi:hypothetical protein